MGTADHGGASSWTARYVTVLSQARWLVLASWALLSVLAAWQGPLFLSECVMRERTSRLEIMTPLAPPDHRVGVP